MKNFYIKLITNNKRLLQIETLNNHKRVCKILKLNKIQYFTYTPKTGKNQTILLKDLEGTEIVLQELTKKKYRKSKIHTNKKVFHKKNP